MVFLQFNLKQVFQMSFLLQNKVSEQMTNFKGFCKWYSEMEAITIASHFAVSSVALGVGNWQQYYLLDIQNIADAASLSIHQPTFSEAQIMVHSEYSFRSNFLVAVFSLVSPQIPNSRNIQICWPSPSQDNIPCYMPLSDTHPKSTVEIKSVYILILHSL